MTAYPCSQLFQGYNFKWQGIQQLCLKTMTISKKKVDGFDAWHS